MADYHFYASLACAAYYATAPADERDAISAKLKAHQKQIEIWVGACAANFQHRSLLVAAEIARIEDRALEAMQHYEDAVRLAHAHGFAQNEALANELAARFYAQRGFEKIAHAYLRDARYGYLRWGADGKVRQLDELHPHVWEEQRTVGSTSTMVAPVEHLDLATVIRVSQAVSGEMVLEKLLDTLMRTGIEQAGGERGLLILSRGAEPRILAEATVTDGGVLVQLQDELVSSAALPQSVLQYVLRTQESVILDDAVAHPSYAGDVYIRQHQARSVLCVPLINQSKFMGVLYLENNLTPHVFVPTRIAVLKLLASQAAISLENTLLYRDLEQRESKIRRLFDANIIGILLWDLKGQILEANDAFLRIVGYDREDLISSPLRWTDLTPSEWLDRDQQVWVPELKMTGSIQPFEKEFFRKDGSRVPVLVGVATFEENVEQGIAFVLDLSERKRAEAEVRESDRRYREAQMELAHANRVTTMGQLAASIAHEVSQPIAAAASNAQAGLRWLGADPPDLEEVRQAFGRIVENTGRAGDVIGRIRALIKKVPPGHDRLDINETILEVIELTRSELLRHRVSLQTELAQGLPPIRGDRIQLQQIILNLTINAIEAMRDAGEGSRELLISTAQDRSNGVLIGVQDSGPGLSPESLDRLFDPFYTTKPDGIGMGLSICRSIIEAHGGRMWAAANVPKGATFQFTLPTHPDTAS